MQLDQPHQMKSKILYDFGSIKSSQTHHNHLFISSSNSTSNINESYENVENSLDNLTTSKPFPSFSDECLDVLFSSDEKYRSSVDILYPNFAYSVVVAIDFGTTYSGYAFALMRNPEVVYVMRKWEGDDPGVANQKMPTSILLTPDEQFHSFGFQARNFYHDLESVKAKSWLYFEKFKMHLHHTEDLNLNSVLTASNGKKVNALKIFTYVLAYFKNYALRELSDQTNSMITESAIKWVVTVPAIWRQPAKAFMRQAAYLAGIASTNQPDKLTIALEPEAASIYIRQLRGFELLYTDHLYTIDLEVEADLSKYNEVRYMVVDCGGGTVDITVHDLNSYTETLRELYKATGGPYGSTAVDNEFENLLIDIFGRDFIETYKAKRPSGFVDLMIAFEARKRIANLDKSTFHNIALPFSFFELYKKMKNQTVEFALKKYNDPNCKWSNQGMLRISIDKMYKLFEPALNNIKKAINQVANLPEVKPINYMFLVGGFAESPLLQQEIRCTFKRLMKIVIPQDVTLAILRGAVLYGINPNIINVRRSRLTYGVSIMRPFNINEHPTEKMIVKNDKEWCADIFDKFVIADQSVAAGDMVVRSYTPVNKNQEKSVINFYCSEDDRANFVSDNGVQRIGTLTLEFPFMKSNKRREIQTQMVFGDTEIKVSAIDVMTGKYVKAIIDFLNE